MDHHQCSTRSVLSAAAWTQPGLESLLSALRSFIMRRHAIVLQAQVSSFLEFHTLYIVDCDDIPSLKSNFSHTHSAFIHQGRACVLFLTRKWCFVSSLSFLHYLFLPSFPNDRFIPSGCRSAFAQHAFPTIPPFCRSFGSRCASRPCPRPQEGSSKTLFQGP